MPPQEWLDRKSTGDVTPGVTGYLRRKSSSAGFISLFINRIWGHKKQEGLWNSVAPAPGRAHFLSAWLDPNWAVGLRSKRFSGELVLENKPCRRWKPASVPTWKASWAVYVSLSHSNRPLVVYWKTEAVMLSIRLDTRCFRASSGSAFRTAFWKTTLNAWGHTRSRYNSQIDLHFWYYSVTSSTIEILLNMEPGYKKQYIKLCRSMSGFYWRLNYKWDLIMVCHSPMTWCIWCGWY